MSRDTGAIRAAMESIENEAPGYDNLTYSSEGAKGAILGFLLGTGAQAIAPFLGGAVAGATYEENIEITKRDILHVSKQIAALQNKDVAEATRLGLRTGNQTLRGHRKKALERMDHTQVLKMALAGLVLSPITASFQGSKYEDLQKELAEKLVELKLAYAKRGIHIHDDDED